MKKSVFKDGDIAPAAFFALAFAAVAAKILLSLCQYATIYPPLAPIDDDLLFKMAVSISRGRWLGEYNRFTLSKHSFFSLWLAFLHSVKMPYLAGNALLWAARRRIATAAFSPFFKKRYHKLFVFVFLLYNPAQSAGFSTRVYRDSIFPALCLIFISSCVAMAARFSRPGRGAIWRILCGASFGCIFLCREDGAWVLPRRLGSLLITAVFALVFKGEKSLARAAKSVAKYALLRLSPFLLSAGIIRGWRYENYRYYGIFAVSDFSRGPFKEAYGAMTSLARDSWNPMVAVPRDVREDLFRQAESFAPFRDALEEPLLVNGYKNKKIDDFQSGSFYWALRQAASNLGIYESPQKARRYFSNLRDEIQRAVGEGRLETRNGGTKLRRSLTPPIKLWYVPAVAKEGFKSFFVRMTFAGRDPLAEPAVGRPDEIRPVEDFIYRKGATARIENTDIPYLSPARKIAHGILRFIRAAYRIITPLGLLLSALWRIKAARGDVFMKKISGEGFLATIILCLICLALLRCAMIAFMEVSSFGIGTYPMYLSTVHPLLILCRRLGFVKNFEC